MSNMENHVTVYNFCNPILTCMQEKMKNARKFVVRIVLAVVVVGILILTSGTGGILNRGQGGFIYFGIRNKSDPSYGNWYWSRHVLSRIYFAIPTGLLVLLLGLHCRAALIVTVMTWLSLYVRDSYINIGLVDNITSRTGYLDWLVGHQGENWTVNDRFAREYAGLSLQGLLLTAPQGYLLEHLGFGWEYSLSGSLMGLVYYAGAQANLTRLQSTFLDCNISLSEILWGWFLWFVLSTVSLSQLVRRSRRFLHKRNPYLAYKPFSTCEILKYESLNRIPFRAAYEILMLTLNLLFCCSLMFYELVEQRDMRSKGQKFFSLFTAVLCLNFALGWTWSTRYIHWQIRKISRGIAMQRQSPTHSSSVVSSSSPSSSTTTGSAPTLRTNLRGGQLSRTSKSKKSETLQKPVTDKNEGYSEYGAVRDETEPLLVWPYSHPDRLSPTQETGSINVEGSNNRLLLPEGETELGMAYHLQPASTSTALLILWQNIENWIWMDVFVWIRRFVGIVSLVNVVLLMVMVVLATYLGWDNPRFMQQCSKG